MRVVLIGAGVSSSIISLLLRRQYGPTLQLVVLDKGRAIGGRMTTSYDNEINPQCSVDTGAQYLTLTKSNGLTSKFFQQLIDDHVIELLDRQNTIGVRENPNRVDYVAPRGIASVVRYFFEQAAVEMNLSKRVTQINLNADSQKFHVSSDDEQFGEAEAVIVTVPVPQVLTQFQGSIAQFLENQPELKKQLADIKYSSRFAVGLFYPSSVTSLNVPWRVYYVNKNDHDCLRFLAIDTAKRNHHEPPFSLIAHTSVEFGSQHADDDKKVIGEQIKEQIFQFLPELPRNVSQCKYHKWKYSQVIQPFADQSGYALLNEQPPLFLAGDSFASESNFEACIHAAVETVKRFSTLLA